jgi:hypothetical protein
MCQKRICSIAFVIVLVSFAFSIDAFAAPGLVLWNKLGSNAEVLDSAYGPDLAFYTGGGWPDVQGDRAYIPGRFGNAVKLAGGPYGTADRVHNIVLDNLNNYVCPERGTVEAWFNQIADPINYQRAIYRVFDGAYGLGSGMYFDSTGEHSFGPRFRFALQFGGSSVSANSLTDGLQGFNISPYNGTWIHLVGVWDRAGVAGSADKLRLYLNGVVVATNSSGSWGSVVGSRADICGGQDADSAGRFYVDNLKLWNYAETRFPPERFCQEGWTPEPSTLVLLIVTGLLGRRPRF